MVLHAAALPRADGAGRRSARRRRPRVVGVARAPRDRIADREPVPAVAPADAVYGRARPRDRRDVSFASVNVAHHHPLVPRPKKKDQEKRNLKDQEREDLKEDLRKDQENYIIK